MCPPGTTSNPAVTPAGRGGVCLRRSGAAQRANRHHLRRDHSVGADSNDYWVHANVIGRKVAIHADRSRVQGCRSGFRRSSYGCALCTPNATNTGNTAVTNDRRGTQSRCISRAMRAASR
jgi:hypothetical protein